MNICTRLCGDLQRNLKHIHRNEKCFQSKLEKRKELCTSLLVVKKTSERGAWGAYSQSRDIPTYRHFLKRQYWHRFLLSLMITQWPSRRHRYSICFWMLRRKKPWNKTRSYRQVTLSAPVLATVMEEHLLSMKSTVSWDVTPCSLAEEEGTCHYRLYLKGKILSPPLWSADSSALETEAALASLMAVKFRQTLGRHTTVIGSTENDYRTSEEMAHAQKLRKAFMVSPSKFQKWLVVFLSATPWHRALGRWRLLYPTLQYRNLRFVQIPYARTQIVWLGAEMDAL
jgi:hypothetical protein